MGTKNAFLAVSWPEGIPRPLFDTDGDGDAGNPDHGTGGDAGAGDGDDTSRGADTSRASSTGAPNGQPGARGQQPPAGNGQRPGSQSPAGGGTGAGATVPSSRLRDANRTIRTLQTKLAQYEQGQGGNRGGQQQPGQQPRKPQRTWTPEQQEIREGLFEVAPWMRRLDEADDETLDQIFSGNPAQRAEALEKVYWQRIGAQHLREVEARVKTAYGDDVDPRTVRLFQSGFLADLEQDPDLRERYLDGDPNIVDEYWKSATSVIVEPIRNKASSEATERAERVNRLPIMPRRGGPVGQPRRQENKPKDENELHDQAWNAMLERSGAIAR